MGHMRTFQSILMSRHRCTSKVIYGPIIHGQKFYCIVPASGLLKSNFITLISKSIVMGPHVIQAVWPDSAKFCHFGILWFYLCNIWQTLIILWHSFNTNGQTFIALNAKILIKESGHLVTLHPRDNIYLSSFSTSVSRYFKKNGPILASFCKFSSFSHHNSNINWKSIDVVIGDRTRACRMIGADTELWRLP